MIRFERPTLKIIPVVEVAGLREAPDTVGDFLRVKSCRLHPTHVREAMQSRIVLEATRIPTEFANLWSEINGVVCCGEVS